MLGGGGEGRGAWIMYYKNGLIVTILDWFILQHRDSPTLLKLVTLNKVKVIFFFEAESINQKSGLIIFLALFHSEVLHRAPNIIL